MEKQDKIVAILISVLFLVLIGVLLVVFLGKEGGGSYHYSGPGGDYAFFVKKDPASGLELHYLRTYIDGKYEYQIPLRNSPMDIEWIPSENVKDIALVEYDNNKNDYIYITQSNDLANLTNGGSTMAAYEIGLVTGVGRVYGIYTDLASTEENSNGLKVVTCDDVPKNVGVIELRFGEPRVYAEGECVIVQGDTKENIIASAEKLIMHLIGVF